MRMRLREDNWSTRSNRSIWRVGDFAGIIQPCQWEIDFRISTSVLIATCKLQLANCNLQISEGLPILWLDKLLVRGGCEPKAPSYLEIEWKSQRTPFLNNNHIISKVVQKSQWINPLPVEKLRLVVELAVVPDRNRDLPIGTSSLSYVISTWEWLESKLNPSARFGQTGWHRDTLQFVQTRYDEDTTVMRCWVSR
jgi:hypothetical protein